MKAAVNIGKCNWCLLNNKYSNKKALLRCISNNVIKNPNLENINVLGKANESCGIPEVRGLYGLMNFYMSSGFGVRLHEYIDQKHKELGPVFRHSVSPVKAVFVNSPDEFRRIFRLEGPTPRHFVPEAWILHTEIRNCRRGLLFMDGEEWLQYRRQMNEIMLTNIPTQMVAKSCQNAAEFLANRWKAYADGEISVPELNNQLYQWSIEVMLSALIGPRLWNEHKDRLQKHSKILASILHKIFIHTAQLSALPAKLAMQLKLPPWTKFVKCIDDATTILRDLIPEMLRLKGDGFLQFMVSEGIKEDDLTRIAADLIIAAGDTSANAMQWSLFLLGSSPAVQEKLYTSIEDLDQTSTLRNAYLKAVVKESLRLYPTAPFLTRYLAENGTIGSYPVSKEELVVLSLYSSCRDPANFVRPNDFWPERWIRNENGKYEGVIVPHAWIPFAMGARSCVGRKLAETQLYLTIAELVRNFEIRCVNKDNIKLILHMISVPSEPVQLTLTTRKR